MRMDEALHEEPTNNPGILDALADAASRAEWTADYTANPAVESSYKTCFLAALLQCLSPRPLVDIRAAATEARAADIVAVSA